MPKSRALLCRRPARKAVVFVHGWAGSAGDTWEAFPAAIRLMDKASSTDAFFLEYPSTEHSVDFCAAQFGAFMRDLLGRAARIVQPSLPNGEARAGTHNYEHIVVIAHSMGAVVARRAVLDLDREGTRHELGKVVLLFFAPAHKGSQIPSLIQSGLCLDWLPGASLVGALLALRYRSLGDLAPGSECLTSLAADSATARADCAEGKRACGHLRAYVHHAQDDKVVLQGRFDDDYGMRPIMRKNHRTICKPDDQYSSPIAALEALL
jgi:pimeloyl-ACP methyl ester carboxylesterase